MTKANKIQLIAGPIAIGFDNQFYLFMYLASKMEGFGKVASIGVMYVIQTIINVLIPSSSAKAAITMPIMAPFS
ncbi:MAG: hypothetical protein U9Q83_08310, partial [Bacteroidota bacterium]|nr:hypothetical protein [Bacteroidota bacterium]